MSTLFLSAWFAKPSPNLFSPESVPQPHPTPPPSPAVHAEFQASLTLGSMAHAEGEERSLSWSNRKSPRHNVCHGSWVSMAYHAGNDTTEVQAQHKCWSLKLKKRGKGRRCVDMSPQMSHFSETLAAAHEMRTKSCLVHLVGWLW